MDLSRVEEFMVICNEGSFKKAAEKLGIAPSVLSSRFQSFEASVGTKLLVRNSRSITPTDSGRLLMQNAPELLASWEGAKEGILNLHGDSYQSLRLQLCGNTMPAELGPYMDRYCRANPRLFLDLYDENTCTIREGLISGKVDMAFAVGGEDDFTDIPGRIELAHHRHQQVFVPGDHRLASKTDIMFSELSGETFILYPAMKETSTRELQLSLLEKSGIKYQIYGDECSPFFYELLVPIGKGIRLWNWNDRLAPNTVSLTIRDEGYDTWLYLLYQPDTDNKTVQGFIDGFLDFRKGRV